MAKKRIFNFKNKRLVVGKVDDIDKHEILLKENADKTISAYERNEEGQVINITGGSSDGSTGGDIDPTYFPSAGVVPIGIEEGTDFHTFRPYTSSPYIKFEAENGFEVASIASYSGGYFNNIYDTSSTNTYCNNQLFFKGKDEAYGGSITMDYIPAGNIASLYQYTEGYPFKHNSAVLFLNSLPLKYVSCGGFKIQSTRIPEGEECPKLSITNFYPLNELVDVFTDQFIPDEDDFEMFIQNRDPDRIVSPFIGDLDNMNCPLGPYIFEHPLQRGYPIYVLDFENRCFKLLDEATDLSKWSFKFYEGNYENNVLIVTPIDNMWYLINMPEEVPPT